MVAVQRRLDVDRDGCGRQGAVPRVAFSGCPDPPGVQPGPGLVHRRADHYDFEIVVDNPAFESVAPDPAEMDHSGGMTVGRVAFTADQKLLIVALCENFLSRGHPGTTEIPSSAAAAARIGWTITRFNRKLDNVCQKLADAGTRGLHGGIGNLACNRKSRLVEHALSTRLVTEQDLALLGGRRNR